MKKSFLQKGGFLKKRLKTQKAVNYFNKYPKRQRKLKKKKKQTNDVIDQSKDFCQGINFAIRVFLTHHMPP